MPPRTIKKPYRRVQMVLDPESERLLEAIAAARKANRSTVVRQLLVEEARRLGIDQGDSLSSRPKPTIEEIKAAADEQFGRHALDE